MWKIIRFFYNRVCGCSIKEYRFKNTIKGDILTKEQIVILKSKQANSQKPKQENWKVSREEW